MVSQMRDGPSTDRRKTINLSVGKRDGSRATSAVQAVVYSINRDATKYKEKKTTTNISTCAKLLCKAAQFFFYLLPQVKPAKLLRTLADSEEAALVFVMFENVE